MAYIWNNYNEDKVFELNPAGSAYYEVFDPKQDRIKVNRSTRLRYLISILEELKQNEDFRKQEDKYRDLFNLALHFQVKLDLASGDGLNEVFMEILCEDIKAGVFGSGIWDRFKQISAKARREILWYLSKYYLGEQKKSCYQSVLQSVFNLAFVHYEKCTSILHICLNEENTENNVITLELVNYFFKDMSLQVNVLWKGKHLGIVDAENTMLIEQFALI